MLDEGTVLKILLFALECKWEDLHDEVGIFSIDYDYQY